MTDTKRQNRVSSSKRRNRGSLVNGHRRTPHDRTKSTIATSAAAAKAYLERSGSPLILPEDVKVSWQGMMSHAAVMALGVDTRYQREEIAAEVNMLIHVLNHGGQIPDQVSIAERPDGTRWVVDGQQRWWAHVDTGKPMQARVFKVKDFEQELTLFHVLNNTRKLTAKTRIQSWPGPSGDAVQWLAQSQDSPLRGLVDFVQGKAAFPVVTVFRGLATAVVGSLGNGSIDKVAANFDRVSDKDKRWVDKATIMFASVLAASFEQGQPLRHLSSIALGRICHATWRPLGIDDAWPMPSPKEASRIRKLDWEKLAPGFAIRWLPVLTASIRNIWGGSADPDEYVRSRAKKVNS